MSTVHDGGSGELPAGAGFVAAWHVEPGSLLADGRRVVHVQHDPVRREVGLVLLSDHGRTVREWWLDAAPMRVVWRPGDPLPRRRPGVALRALAGRLGLPG